MTRSRPPAGGTTGSLVLVARAYGGPEQQALVERDVPAPGPGEVLVRVRAAAVNPADVKRREGLFGTTRTPPVPLGLELSGVVEALGPDVTDLDVGDGVVGSPRPGAGAFAEHTLVRRRDVVPKPAALPHDVAATLPIAGTAAWDAFHQVDPGPGRTLLVVGVGGGVGDLVAQLAVAAGTRVVGTGSESKRARAESLGVTFVTSGPAALAAVRAAGPVDAVLDLAGGEALRSLVEVVADRASVVSAADPTAAVALGGRALVRGPDVLADVVAAAAEGRLCPNVTATYPLTRAAEALAQVEGRHAAGKVVVLPGA